MRTIPHWPYRPGFAATFLMLDIVCPLSAQDAKVLSVENIAQAAKANEGGWATAVKDESLAVGDRFRPRQRSRATLRLTDLYTMRLEQFTTIQLTQAMVSGEKPKFDLSGGVAFIFSREETGEIDTTKPAANGLCGARSFWSEGGLSKCWKVRW